MTTRNPQNIIPAWAPSALAEEYLLAVDSPANRTYAAVLTRLLHPKAEGVWRDFEALVDKTTAAERAMLEKLSNRQGVALNERLKGLTSSILETETTNLLGVIGQAVAPFEASAIAKETRAERKTRLNKLALQIRLVARCIEDDPDTFNNLLPYVASSAWPSEESFGDVIAYIDQKAGNAAFADTLERLEQTAVSDVLKRMADALELDANSDEDLVKSPSKGLRPHLTRALKKHFRDRYNTNPDSSPPKVLVEFCQLAIYGWPSSGERGDLSDQEATNYVRATKI